MPGLRQFEALLDLLAELSEANRATPILVEGRRDVEALRALGCEGDVIALHAGETRAALVEGLAARTRDLILLFDWDAQGGAFLDELRPLLESSGVRCDVSFRGKIPPLVRAPLKDVESLPAYVRRGLDAWHGRSLEEHLDEAHPEAWARLKARLDEEWP